jgi:hypothetical protein
LANCTSHRVSVTEPSASYGERRSRRKQV